MEAATLLEYAPRGDGQRQDQKAALRTLQECLLKFFLATYEAPESEGNLEAASIAIDVLLDTPEVRTAMADFRKVVPAQPWQRTKPEQKFHPAVFLDMELGTNVRKAIKIANETSVTVAGGKRDLDTTVAAEVRSANPLWFFEDPNLPRTYVEGLLAARRAELETALVDYMTCPVIRNVKLARELARLWVQDMNRYAVFVASIPTTRVSQKIVPADKRRDMDAERTERKTALDTLAKI